MGLFGGSSSGGNGIKVSTLIATSVDGDTTEFLIEGEGTARGSVIEFNLLDKNYSPAGTLYLVIANHAYFRIAYQFWHTKYES